MDWLDREPDLAPDLEWALQSGQLPRRALAEALLDAYYLPVMRLVVALVGTGPQAHSTVRRAFAQALLNAYRYQDADGPERWFYTQALPVVLQAARVEHTAPAAPQVEAGRLCRMFADLEPGEREVIAWQAATGLSLALLAAVLGENVERLETVQAQAYSRLLEVEPPLDDPVVVRLNQELQECWPVAPLSETAQRALAAEVERQAARQERSRRWWAQSRELAFTLLAALVFGLVIWGSSAFLPDESARRQATNAATAQPTAGVSSRRIGPAYVIPRPGSIYFVQPDETLEEIATRLGVSPERLRANNRLPDDQQPEVGQLLNIPAFQPAAPAGLNLDSSSEAIYKRIITSPRRWRTLSVEALVTLDGSQAQRGRARSYRVSFWWDRRNGEYLVLTSAVDGQLQEIYLRHAGQAYLARTEDATPPYRLMPVDENEFVLGPYLSSLITRPAGDLDDPNFTYQPTAYDQLDPWKTLVVERRSPRGAIRARLWLAPDSGFLVRQQYFGSERRTRMLLSTTVISAEFDGDLPRELFDPGHLWHDQTVFRANRALLRDMNPPSPVIGVDLAPELDLAQAELSFRIAHRTPVQHTLLAQSVFMADIYAGDQYLGRSEFGDPWTMICARSTDGRRLAFVDELSTPDGRRAPLRLIDLAHPEDVWRPFDHLFITSFAFSPDGRTLAAYGYVPPANGAVYLLDLESGTYRQYLRLEGARSFVWSPDSRSLALIGRVPPKESGDSASQRLDSISGEQLLVLKVDTGEVTSRLPMGSSIQAGVGMIGEHSLLTWGRSFPVRMNGLERCSSSTL